MNHLSRTGVILNSLHVLKKILLKYPYQNYKHEQVAIHDIDQSVILYGRACRSLIQYEQNKLDKSIQMLLFEQS